MQVDRKDLIWSEPYFRIVKIHTIIEFLKKKDSSTDSNQVSKEKPYLNSKKL